MDGEHRGIALVILGIIAIIAVIGLVLMFSQSKGSAGAIFTSATNGQYVCPIDTNVGEPQWFPILAGPYENREFMLSQWLDAGYECVDVPSPTTQIDEYAFSVVACCRNPVVGEPGINPQVLDRGPVPIETRQGYGVPVGQFQPSPKAFPAPAQQFPPRVGP